jgi:hypothetical protein
MGLSVCAMEALSRNTPVAHKHRAYGGVRADAPTPLFGKGNGGIQEEYEKRGLVPPCA